MKLVLFLTLGGSLQQWHDLGILEREIALYKHHANAGWTIDIISYGVEQTETELAAQYRGISVHYNKWRLHPRLYSLLIPLLHRKVLRRADGFKTNQMYGSHQGIAAASFWNKPLVIRQGYGHYLNRCAEHGENSYLAKKALEYEAQALKSAQGAIFSTRNLADNAVQMFGIAEDKIAIIPNYVDTSIWIPGHLQRSGGDLRLVYFGRFSEEKNLPALLQACEGLPVKLTLIGQGQKQRCLEKLSQKLAVACSFLPRLNPKELRQQLNYADVFVLPSLYEGHPKALIEAMCSGILVLGADSPGIREILDDPEKGLLSGVSVVELRRAINTILTMPPEERQRIGNNGQTWAINAFDIDNIARLERSTLQRLWQE
jgi:glycosyltransferase involved in cell wall biosynthesis